MSSVAWYALLIALVALERVVELGVSRRHVAWAFARGGVERGRGHYPPMVLLHAGLLVGCAVEPWLAGRPFLPLVGWPMLGLVLLAQGLRWWCIHTLGPRWSTRVIVIPGRARKLDGPYRFLRHPNYVAVVLEGVALPLVHTAWISALVFTLLDALVLGARMRCEDEALDWAEDTVRSQRSPLVTGEP